VCGVALQSCCDRNCFEKTSKQSFEVEQIQLGELEGRSLKIGKRKYIIKTFVQKCGM
jgi:hypothetical protein